MTYNETVNWMFKQLPMYQRQGKTAFKKDLSNTINLAQHLNHPERQFKSIHVAGTNGKGSTSHMLASILQEAGYKVGLYTSPHLKDFRERIKINGHCISKQFVIGFIKRNKPFLESHKLSFFEMTVGMAFDYFAKQKVDIAVVEVGLGGRLDSTNIIYPEVSVITNIGFDHTQFLGDTYEAIASEKAGIIKTNVPVVIGETQRATRSVFRDMANAKQADIYFADTLVKANYLCDLKGNYQIHNIKTVVQTIDVLNKTTSFNISEANLKMGLLRVIPNTGLKGRWQVVSEQPRIICDTAHNREGLSLVVEQLNSEIHDQLHIVFGVVNDKNIDTILPLLPKAAMYYCCKPNVPRGLDAKVLHSSLETYGLNAKVFSSVANALKAAKLNAQPNDLIFVGGSTFVVAEIV